MRTSRAMSRIVRLSTSSSPPVAPMTEKMDESSEQAAHPFPPARSSCGSTSSRWPSLAAGAWALVHPRRRRRTPTPHLPWWAVALGFAVRRDLRRPRPLPPQRALLLARRPAVRLRPRVRHRRRLRDRRAHRHRHRLGPDPPAGARQAPLQPRPARARRRRSPPAMLQPRRRRRRRAAARDLGRPVRRDALQRRAHDPAARRRDRDRRGQRRRRRCSSRCSPPTRWSR